MTDERIDERKRTVRNAKRTVRNVTIFSVAALLCGWAGVWVDGATGANGAAPDQGLGMLIWLGTPLIVSLLLRGFAGDGWQDLGLPLHLRGNLSMYLISLLLYPAAALMVIGAGAVTGSVQLAGLTLGELAPLFGMLLLTGFPKNIIEEFAWRGYLAPKLFLLGIDALAAHVLVGLIWGAWHLPYLSFVLSYLVEDDPPMVVTRFLLGTVAASLVYGEIRLRTDSVWPAVLMHTVGGAFIAVLVVDALEIAPGVEYLFSPGIEGTLMIAIFSLVGLGLYARRTAEGREIIINGK
jgi:membrane protease YdiL (CAAX protease family)